MDISGRGVFCRVDHCDLLPLFASQLCSNWSGQRCSYLDQRVDVFGQIVRGYIAVCSNLSRTLSYTPDFCGLFIEGRHRSSTKAATELHWLSASISGTFF